MSADPQAAARVTGVLHAVGAPCFRAEREKVLTVGRVSRAHSCGYPFLCTPWGQSRSADRQAAGLLQQTA
jgi:hypothetical protein